MAILRAGSVNEPVFFANDVYWLVKETYVSRGQPRGSWRWWLQWYLLWWLATMQIFGAMWLSWRMGTT